MSDKVIIDLTECIAGVGLPVKYRIEFLPRDELLPFPQAKFNCATAELTVSFVKPNVHVQGTIHCLVNGYCDRCLTEISRWFDIPFDQLFWKDCAEVEDGYVYSGSRLDATKAICDEIILAMPSGLLCKEDCKGLCPKCGANLNERQCGCDTSRENAFSALKNLKF